MENELLRVEVCCINYNIEYDFIEMLHEHNLIEIVDVNKEHYIHADALSNLESLLRMHYDLDINLEGIEVINNLLSRINNMHRQMMHLKDKLKIYENENRL
jgi:hypothetical protein